MTIGPSGPRYRYEGAIASAMPWMDPPPMKKRVGAGLLWFYVTWTAWCFLAAFTGLPGAAGPVIGAVVGMFIAGDPLGRIWGARSAAQPVRPAPAGHTEPV